VDAEIRTASGDLPPEEQRPVAEVFVDGAARGNPGPAGIGIVIRLDGQFRRHKEFVGRRTNNEAEYLALLKALSILSTMKVSRAVIYSDSELLVKQLSGEYKVRSGHLRNLHQKALRQLSMLSARVVHVDRPSNDEADRLANEAIDESSS